MIKILFFIPGLSEGGAEKVLCNLVNNMDQSKFDITVQTLDSFEPRQYLREGIHYKAINYCKTKLGKKIFSYWYRLCAQLKLAYPFFVKGDYDVEIAYLETGATKIIAQSTNRRALKLAWVHCDLSKKEGMADSVKKVRKQYKAYDKIVCVSDDVCIGFHKLYGGELETVVLHNIIDDEEIMQKAEIPIDTFKVNDRKQLLAVGRLTEQKNFTNLIDTCSRLRKDGYQFHLYILGEGPERENLKNQIKKLHLENIVELKGFTNNPYPWMKAADIIVCSSKYEGISTVVQEAFILGKPIVTTPCTGMHELLGDSEYGLIVENSEVGLYEGLKKLFDDPEKEQYFAYASQERSKEFVKKKIIRETETFFLRELQKKQSASIGVYDE